MRRMVLWFCLVFLVGECLFRSLTCGWGPPRVAREAPDLVRFGIVYNSDDNLFYLSLAQQARSGLWWFGNIYTTTEHPRVLVNLLFLAVGWVSRWSSVSPIVVLNVASLVALVVFVVNVGEGCRILGYRTRTSFVVLCLCLGGGGTSWVRFLFERAGLAGILQIGPMEGPDLFFLDLYPAMAFTVYPFHSVSLALLSVLTRLVLRFDDPGRPFSWTQWLLVGLSATVLTGVRPYEPLVVLICAGITAVLSMATALPGVIKRRRWSILVCLAVGVIPFELYNAWVSRQPVFVDWSKVALNLYPGANWASAMLMLWTLVASALLSFRKQVLATPLIFLAVWCLFCASLLVVLSSGLTKFCGGCTIPLALLAGTAVERLWRQVPSRKVADWIAVGLACLALGSPILAYYSILKKPIPGLPSDLLRAVEAIRSDAKSPVPTVLAGPEAGLILPGIGGCRVFYGHDGLDVHHARRRALLTRLGFHPGQGEPTPVVNQAMIQWTARELLDEVRSAQFDDILEDQGDTIARWLDPAGQSSTIYRGPRYRVVKMTSAVRLALEDALGKIIEADPEPPAGDDRRGQDVPAVDGLGPGTRPP